MEENYKNLKIAQRGASISLIVYIILSALKLFMGYLTHSKALTADGLNNSTDIISSLAIIIGLKIARKPADEDHSYGHLRAETIAALVAAIIMIAVGIDVIYNGIYSAVFFKAKAPEITSAVIAVICAAIIYFVYVYNKKTAIKINSQALMAAAKDNLSDALVSIGAAVGIIASQFGYPWIDPAASIIVGIIICKTGYEIFKESVHNLTDGFDRNKLDEMVKSINSIKEVKKVRDIKARVHGNNILTDIVIAVDPRLTVGESHKTTEQVEMVLKRDFNVRHVIVHVEPEDR
ncbi:cation diffusion facilitator family transporter [Clostridium guangxiense]|uniref:cation diffusion facilitator family transporter n=1 Tax=Clostridium guangxiense TaxID=1662055 RepID=UPI001E3C8ACB|nr:cation diffusion facilitator family transporter [Clostridium guangxiense]MCD2345560.1 cation diffusion facilitator family transporter [Clostridium guangxiense]